MPSYKDEKTGKWYCKFYYEDWNGEKHQKKKSGFRTKRDAQAWEREFLENQAQSPDILVSVLCDRFLENRAIFAKPKTIETYRIAIEAHIKPILGSVRVCDLTPVHVEQFHKAMSKDYAVSTINHLHAVLSAVLNYGVKFYGIESNPCRTVGRIKARKTEMPVIKPEEFKKILPFCNTTYQVLFSLLFWTGMRIGEARALTKKDIGDGEIHINKNIVRIKGGDVLQNTPKSPNSIRTVEIHPRLNEMLHDYCGRIYDDGARLFPMSDNTIRYAFHTACRKAGVGPVRIHDIRHSHVAMLIRMGYYPKAIAERIGDTPETVMSVYSHIFKEDKRKMADRIGEMYDNS